jgi:hypothetical protein
MHSPICFPHFAFSLWLYVTSYVIMWYRDLKPANILLADTQKSKSKLKRCSGIEAMYDVFKKGYLVAKVCKHDS